MADPKDRINQLQERLDVISSRQMQFSKEIEALKQDIRAIQDVENTRIFKEETAEKESPVFTNESKPEPEKEASPLQETVVPQPEIEEPQPIQKPKKKSDLEKFIGENLISKIGIVIIVIGVGIGAKYSIENELISPLTRIILGYLVGIGLIGFGVKLKKNYENLSAVLGEWRDYYSLFHHLFRPQFLWVDTTKYGLCANGFIYRLCSGGSHQLQQTNYCSF